MTKTMTDAQRSYEAKRAAKAGMSLDKWLTEKARSQQDVARNAQRRASTGPGEAAKKAGLLTRLLDRAHRPL